MSILVHVNEDRNCNSQWLQGIWVMSDKLQMSVETDVSPLHSGPLYNKTTNLSEKGPGPQPFCMATSYISQLPWLKQEKTWQVGKKHGVLQPRATLWHQETVWCPLQSSLLEPWLINLKLWCHSWILTYSFCCLRSRNYLCFKPMLNLNLQMLTHTSLPWEANWEDTGTPVISNFKCCL